MIAGCAGSVPCACLQESRYCADLVAGHELVFAAVVDGNANAVTVGIRRQQQIAADLFRKPDRFFKRLPDLRIRIRARREPAVGLFL